MSKVYVAFPKHLVALNKLPGYFWHRKENKLYSIKVTGTLRPMKASKFFTPYPWGAAAARHGELCYRVSKNGRRLTLFVSDLIALHKEKPTKTTVVPYGE